MKLSHKRSPCKKIEAATTLLVKDLKGGRDQSFRSRPEEVLSSQKSRSQLEKGSRDLELRQ